MPDSESLGKIQALITTTTDGLRQDIAESRRHMGVLTEELRHDVQLLAEGVKMHIESRHAEEREYLDRQFTETRTLLQLSYGQLQERVERLEERVRPIEQRLGRSV